MKHAENTNQENNKQPIDLSKISPGMQAYFEARDALFKKYGINYPQTKE